MLVRHLDTIITIFLSLSHKVRSFVEGMSHGCFVVDLNTTLHSVVKPCIDICLPVFPILIIMNTVKSTINIVVLIYCLSC